MLDKKGRLFGKINIIDLIIILALIFAAVVVGKSYFTKKAETETQTLVMKYYIEEADKFVADKVYIGSPLYDDSANVNLGNVTKVETDDSVSYGTNSEGEYVKSTREGFVSMIITGEVQGVRTGNGALISGEKYGVGHTFTLRAGDAKLYLRVYDISVKRGEQQ